MSPGRPGLEKDRDVARARLLESARVVVLDERERRARFRSHGKQEKRDQCEEVLPRSHAWNSKAYGVGVLKMDVGLGWGVGVWKIEVGV